MKLVLSKNKLKLESEKMQTGESSHELDCFFEKESFEISLNINYMLRALQNMFYRQDILSEKIIYNFTKTKEIEIHLHR